MKKKIVWISDHPFIPSGMGTQSRWLINELIATGKYSFFCIGGSKAFKNNPPVVFNEDLTVYNTEGFGNKTILREVMLRHNPDAVVLFSDPRVFTWLFEIEDEIHTMCPIAYNHVWDNDPVPEFNKVIYDSVDRINCISYLTYKMVSKICNEKAHYIPHAIPPKVFFPLSPEEIVKAKERTLGSRKDHFVVSFVNRNIPRKQAPSTMEAFKLFLDDLEKKYGHRKALLLMHTDPLDEDGPNLYPVLTHLGLQANVILSTTALEFPDMNALFNISDVVINVARNEGFGLTTLESMMTATPIIVLKTGGLTRQVEDPDTDETFGIGLEPEVRSLFSSNAAPYMYEDFVSRETVAKAMMTMYEWGPDKRAEVGKLALEYAKQEFNLTKMIMSWDMGLSNLIDNWRGTERWQRSEL